MLKSLTLLLCHSVTFTSILPPLTTHQPLLFLPTSWITSYLNLLRWNSLKYALLSKYVYTQVTQVLCCWVKDLPYFREERQSHRTLGFWSGVLWSPSNSLSNPDQCPHLTLYPSFLAVVWCEESQRTQRRAGELRDPRGQKQQDPKCSRPSFNGAQ